MTTTELTPEVQARYRTIAGQIVIEVMAQLEEPSDDTAAHFVTDEDEKFAKDLRETLMAAVDQRFLDHIADSGIDWPGPVEAERVQAEPFTARRCPECGVWVYTDDGPFAEGDRTKTLADFEHWEREHEGKGTDFIPFFPYNEEPVEAVREARTA